MNGLDELQDELNKVVKVAVEFKVSHSEVAKSVGISYDYARQIRGAEKPSRNRDTEENRKLLQDLIDCYRKEVRRKQEVMSAIDVDWQ